MTQRPDILLILNDDMGFSDLGCYGGEIDTPNLDRLATSGLRFTQFYNTARCCPTRASLLTGLHPHQAGIGIMTDDSGPEGYAGNLNHRCVTIAEVLRGGGYRTYMCGKWHVVEQPHDSRPTTWPLQRGFDAFYGTIIGAGSFYDPNTLTPRQRQHRARGARPRLLLHRRDQRRGGALHPRAPGAAPRQAVLPVRRLHRAALAAARARRGHREVQGPLRRGLGHVAPAAARAAGRRRASSTPHWKLSPIATRRSRRGPRPRTRPGLLRCMEVYAAQIDRMDQGIGRIVAALEDTGQLDNTLVIFLADNGGCAEDIPEDVTLEELVDKLMIARSHTRSGETVHIRQQPRPACRGPRTPTRATARPGPTCRTRRSASTSTGSTRAASPRR